MIGNKRKLDELYRKLDAEENLSYKEALRIHDELHKGELQKQIANYDGWHITRVNCLSQVIEDGNYRQDNNDTSLALSAKLVNTFMHQLMKYDRFRYLYRGLHLPLDRTVFQRLCRAENDHNELHHAPPIRRGDIRANSRRTVGSGELFQC